MENTGIHDYHPGDVILHGDRGYRIEDLMARGSCGQTWAGRDDWGAEVVIRVLWPFSRTYGDVRESWLQQGPALQRAGHPNLVYIYDSFEHQGRFHLVHERCAYRLESFFELPTWNGPRWFKAVAGSVLCGLEHIHGAGYHHRNLHPRNIFCCASLDGLHPAALPAGGIKIGDFGVTHLIGNVDLMNTQIARWLTPPEYLNPSLLGLMDHRVDIYQAGLLLLAVLLGRVPLLTFEQIAAGVPRDTAARLTSSFGTAVARALALKVEDRFASAREFWQELSGIRQPASDARPAALGQGRAG
jgi:serine/threonine protein kinase